MALVLLKLAIWFLSSCVELLAFVVFRGLALLIVAVIRLVRLPGQATNTALEAAADALGAVGEFVFSLARDAAASVVSAFLEFLWSVLTCLVEMASTAVVELGDKMRAGGEELAKAVPEVLDGASEAVGKLVLKLWENYKDAIGLILENLN